MHTSDHSDTTPNRMSQHRARLRAAGLRPVQIWVPDIRLPKLMKQARKQSLLVASQASEIEALAFIEAAADFGDDA